VGKRDWRVLLHFLDMAERGEVDVGRPLADAELAAEGIGKLGRDALRAEVRCSLLAGVLHCMLAQLIHFLCEQFGCQYHALPPHTTHGLLHAARRRWTALRTAPCPRNSSTCTPPSHAPRTR
jgi:hypothetical protein